MDELQPKKPINTGEYLSIFFRISAGLVISTLLLVAVITFFKGENTSEVELFEGQVESMPASIESPPAD